MFSRINAVLEMPADASASAGGGALGYGGFWRRVAAFFVDWAILMILTIVLAIGSMVLGEVGTVIGNLVIFVVSLLYFPVMESSARQATFGKQLLGMKVTDLDGERLSFVRALLRYLAKFISAIPFGLGFLLAAFTSRKQALHDIITKCLVVREGPSHFLKAVVAAVGGLVISIGAMGAYFYYVYMPQTQKDMGQAMEKSMKEAGKSAPEMKSMPAKPPVAKAPTPAPAPAVKPAREKTAPGEPKLMTPQEIAEFEKKMEQAKREPAKVAAVTPPAPVAKAKPEPKPAAVPAAKPKPAPAPAAEASTALVSEPPAPPPPPAPSAAQPKPAAPAAVAVAPALRPARSPKFNDVMTAVMYRDAAAATELLDLGSWVDRPDSNGVSPLMAAAWNGDVAMTQLLLKGGADPNRRGPAGSVLDYAGRGGDIQVIELLKRSGAR